MEKVYHFRIINGDEVLGKISKETDHSITIVDPLVVNEAPIGMGTSGIVLTNYTPFSGSNHVSLAWNHVITITELHPIVVEYYNHSLQFAYKADTEMLNKIDMVNSLVSEQLSDSNTRVIHSGSRAIN